MYLTRDIPTRLQKENIRKRHADMTANVRQFVVCVTWPIHMCDMTHSYVWHDSFICVTWLICMCDMTANVRQFGHTLSHLKYYTYVERDLCVWNETYVCEKRPMCVKRDLCMWKETCVCEKRPMYVERDLCVWKETYACETRPMCVKRDLCMWKETYVCEKRPLCVKRDLCKWKETHLCEKRPMYVERNLYWNHLPWFPDHTSEPLGNLGTGQVISGATNMSKETCVCEKRAIPETAAFSFSSYLRTAGQFGHRPGHLRYYKYVKRDVCMWKETYTETTALTSHHTSEPPSNLGTDKCVKRDVTYI